MSSFVIQDPLFSKGLHGSTHPSPSLPIQNTFFVGKVVPKIDTCNGFRIKGGKVGLTLKGCFEFESHKKKGDADSKSIMHNALAIARSQQFTVHRADVEIEDKKDAGSANGSRWSNRSGFPHQNSPQKIVVAVDVDEGIDPSRVLCSIPWCFDCDVLVYLFLIYNEFSCALPKEKLFFQKFLGILVSVCILN